MDPRRVHRRGDYLSVACASNAAESVVDCALTRPGRPHERLGRYVAGFHVLTEGHGDGG